MRGFLRGIPGLLALSLVLLSCGAPRTTSRVHPPRKLIRVLPTPSPGETLRAGVRGPWIRILVDEAPGVRLVGRRGLLVQSDTGSWQAETLQVVLRARYQPPPARLCIRRDTVGMFAGRVLISAQDTLRKGFFFQFDASCPETLTVPRPVYGLWEVRGEGGTRRMWSRELRVYPADGKADRGIRYRGQAYPGKFRLVPGDPAQGILVINEVPVEVYLPGVVQAEMGAQFPLAALQAQAVAARTYVVRRLLEDGPDRAFHLYGDPRHQAYRGASVVEKVRQAVWATRGLTLFESDGQTPAYTFYSANCGGMLASGAEVFGVDAPYLRPHRDGKGDTLFCEYATRYVPALRWFRKREYWRAFLPWHWLNRTFRDIAPVRRVRILAFSPSGRVRALQIVGVRGTRVVEGQARVRRLLGKRLLPSTLFRVRATREGVWLEGWGHGHGVGMCQVGAGGMASLGYSARQILAHYYPGTRLRRLW